MSRLASHRRLASHFGDSSNEIDELSIGKDAVGLMPETNIGGIHPKNGLPTPNDSNTIGLSTEHSRSVN